MYSALPKTEEARVLGRQLLRSGTSVAANYREASRGPTDAELLAKLGIVEQELD
jgi:four helix bundle protein